jgi:hypothetical protein
MPGHKNQNQPTPCAIFEPAISNWERAVMAREFIRDAHMIEADEHAREQEREDMIESLGAALGKVVV